MSETKTAAFIRSVFVAVLVGTLFVVGSFAILRWSLPLQNSSVPSHIAP